VVPPGELFARDPLTGELQGGCSVVDDRYLGRPGDADDHLDDAGERVANDQPLDTSQLRRHGSHDSGHGGATLPRLVPHDLVAFVTGHRGHCSQLRPRHPLCGRQDRDLDRREAHLHTAQLEHVQ
jgi:hypothetical protein